MSYSTNLPASMQMERPEVPNIHPIDFKTVYVDDPERPGEKIGVDWVTWVNKGDPLQSTTSQKIDRLRANPAKNRPFDDAKWMVIEPFYTKWKEGEGDVENGTPLKAWPGISPDQLAELKKSYVYSLEDLIQMPDAQVGKVRDGRQLKAKAKAFLDSKSNLGGVSEELAKLREDDARKAAKLDEQAKTIEEMQKQMQALAARVAQEPAPKKRGRPPKEATEE